MFKFKERFCDLRGFPEEDLTEDGYITFGLDCVKPFLYEDPDYEGYYDDPGELLEFPVYQDVIPARVVKSPMRTPESDAEAIKWFRRNSRKVWLKEFSFEEKAFILDPDAVVLCYKETLPDGDQYLERYYPLAIMYLSRNGKRHLVKTDLFEEV